MNENGRFPVVFLPGIIMPAALRYAPLMRELGDSVHAVTKDLEVYATNSPPETYSIEAEVEGISRAADHAGFERFHLYGHSGGGASALAYVASQPERVLSLALDEPATDFDPKQQAEMRAALSRVAGLPPQEGTRYFLQRQLAPGVPLPPPPEGPPPPWMAKRPAGIQAFMKAISEYALDTDRLRAFNRPVYYNYGNLSEPGWLAMRDRLTALFPVITIELYEGASHLNTSHQHAPARVAAALRELWQRAASAPSERATSPTR